MAAHSSMHRARRGFALKRAREQAQFAILAGERFGFEPGHADAAPCSRASLFMEQTCSSGARPSSTATGRDCRSGRKRSRGLRRKLRGMYAGIQMRLMRSSPFQSVRRFLVLRRNATFRTHVITFRQNPMRRRRAIRRPAAFFALRLWAQNAAAGYVLQSESRAAPCRRLRSG